MKKYAALLLVVFLISESAFGQMERRRTVTDEPVEVFLTMSLISMSTSSNLQKNNMNSTIMHNFGLVSTGVKEFWGLDQGAAVRLGIDYGITDKLSVGIGRTSREDNVDLRFKYTLLQQMRSGKTPVEISLKGDLGINTQQERRFDYTFQERLNMFGSITIARKFSDAFSFQIAPMISHFNTVVIETVDQNPEHTHYGVGFGGEYRVSLKHSFSFEYFGVFGDRTNGTLNPMALSWQIDTGGHVFQMFIMNGNWFTEQHLIARTTDDFFARDFRIGFNVNRVFGL
ncbi:MAG: hypothetical protein JJ971_08140 [Balneolaceae bacterium]|nr:hypothetical protein [Balneolaceae bacterium]MBO6546793.1 hypothetical protein [Balneolaceae bacterium]MBO6649153.1 hypothetical protein [Balneolaceae bacterium]